MFFMFVPTKTKKPGQYTVRDQETGTVISMSGEALGTYPVWWDLPTATALCLVLNDRIAAVRAKGFN